MIDVDLLAGRFGESTAAVAHCERRDDAEHFRADGTLKDFVEEWKRARASGEQFSHYFKDWHFVQQHPQVRAYETPVFFQDDWLVGGGCWESWLSCSCCFLLCSCFPRSPFWSCLVARVHLPLPMCVGVKNLSCPCYVTVVQQLLWCHPIHPPQNEYYDHLNRRRTSVPGRVCEQRDDYRFVYLGPATSYTPLHCDVLRSFSWSVNVCGRKRWTLYQ
jgi:hypothetical protein